MIKLNGVKSVNMHVTYFLNGSVFSFFVILFYIERKCLLMRNLAIILALKSKLSGKLQRFNAVDWGIEMLKNK